MHKRYWYVIVNPAAGNVRLQWPSIENLLQELGFSYTVKFTNGKNHAAQLAEEAVWKGHRTILGIGGDGLHNEIANGILNQKATAPTDVVFTLLPMGTGNDWARQWGISCNPRKRLQALLEPKVCTQDAGLVQYFENGAPQSRYFVNVAGLAFDAYVTRKAGESSVKNRFKYSALVAQCLFKYQPVQAVLEFNQTEIEDHFYTINAGVCRYSGGGMQVVPHAVPDDGLLALTYAGRVSKMEVIRAMPRFYNGSISQHPKIFTAQTPAIEVRCPPDCPTLLEVDGEFLGAAPVKITVLQKALTIIV